MNSRERVLAALEHRQPDRVPVDVGSSTVTGMHISCVAALRDYLGLAKRVVRVLDPGQMLGAIDDDLKEALGLDVDSVPRRRTRYGFECTGWKPWRMPDGLEVEVPEGFRTTRAASGDILMHPQGDLAAPPSARMPSDGYFFDDIPRQQPIDDDRLDPADNLEEYTPVAKDEVAWIGEAATRARKGGRAVLAQFSGTSLGDVGAMSGPALRAPRGIRSPEEWYISIRTRRPYIQRVFERQTEIVIRNLERVHAAVGDRIDIVYVCGTDFGTQESAFCSPATFAELWLPHYRRITGWVHANTSWKCFKHSCGSVARFIPLFIEAGFDILNPVQCSARNMDPRRLKSDFGRDVVFWGGGVDTQQTLPFGTPGQVRAQVLERCEIFARDGGFVFNTVHNIQARTPVENVVAMFDAVREFNGERSLGPAAAGVRA